MCRRSAPKPPEVARTVAGGPSEASDHRIPYGVEIDPRGVAYDARDAFQQAPAIRSCHVRDPSRVDLGHVDDTGGRSLRSDHRLPYVTPPASFQCGRATAP